MQLIYKGKFKSEAQLPKGNLPPDAVRFREPDSPFWVNLIATLISIPVLIVIITVIIVSAHWHDGIYFGRAGGWTLLGILITLLCFFPHEFLHAVWFGKHAVVELYVSALMLFVVSTQPISKGRFIWLSLFPNLIFGWIPFVIWTALPYIPNLSEFLLSFSIFSILVGCGDYMNVWNALWQMPKGSIQQLSGFHSYWYMPHENKK